jgi:hypothetical protein
MTTTPKKNTNYAPTVVRLKSLISSQYWRNLLRIEGEYIPERKLDERFRVGQFLVTDDHHRETNKLDIKQVGDYDYFEVVGGDLFLKAGTNLDYEQKKTYTVTVTVEDPESDEPQNIKEATFSFNVVDRKPDLKFHDAAWQIENGDLSLRLAWDVYREEEMNGNDIIIRFSAPQHFNSNPVYVNLSDLKGGITHNLTGEKGAFMRTEVFIPVSDLPQDLFRKNSMSLQLNPDNSITESAYRNNSGDLPDKSFFVRMIPGFMRNMSLRKSAEYMDIWFKNKAHQITDPLRALNLDTTPRQSIELSWIVDSQNDTNGRAKKHIMI